MEIAGWSRQASCGPRKRDVVEVRGECCLVGGVCSASLSLYSQCVYMYIILPTKRLFCL